MLVDAKFGFAQPAFAAAKDTAIAAARERQLRGIVVPRANAAEAAVVEDVEVIPVSSLAEERSPANTVFAMPPL